MHSAAQLRRSPEDPMPTLQLTRNSFLTALFLLSSLLYGCGGGGGSGTAQSGTLFDPAAKYQGSSAGCYLRRERRGPGHGEPCR